MKCVFCKEGETRPGTTTLTLEEKGNVVVLRDVPAHVCQNCGEAYLDDAIVARLETILDDAMKSGVQVMIREYNAA